MVRQGFSRALRKNEKSKERKMKKTKAKKAECSSALEKEDYSLSLYIKDLQHIPLMNRKEEELTARKAAEGDIEAQKKLVSANLRFVIKIAKKYRGMGLSMEDLISEGNIGLIEALRGYDVDKGYHFISYAVWWIRHLIQKALYEKARLIRLPQNKIDALLRIERAKKLVQKKQDEKAELLEIAHLVNMDASQVTELLRLNQDPLFLGAPVYETANSVSLEDYIEDENQMSPEDKTIFKNLQDDIESILGSLKKREADIIRARYGLGNNFPMSLEEIGKRFDMSKEGIRQIENRAIWHLQHPSRRRRLESYVA
jgi:RNA polymerase primary sigma factor